MGSPVYNTSVLAGNQNETDLFHTPSQIVVTVILTVYSFIGTIGNATAFYIFFRRRDKSTSVIFILALACCDFFTCLVIIPYTIVFEMLQADVVYDVFCKMFLFLQTSNIPFSACIMVAIAFDRYLCICHPFLQAFTITRAKVIVLCLTLLTCNFGILTCLSFGVYQISTYYNGTDYSRTPTNLTFVQYSAQNGVAGDGGVYVVPADVDTKYENITESDPALSKVIYTGRCEPNQLIVSTAFMNGYQKVYTTVYIITFISVAILYTLIYKSILVRRARKAKRKKRSHYHSVAGAEGTVAETQMTTLNGTANAENKTTENANQPPIQPASKGSVKRQSTMRETNVYANIKTAAMLFVVTLVFIIAFLPSWLMAHDILPMNSVVYYMYFTYNVVNPIIYAFMNQTFREDLGRLMTSCR